MSFGNVIVVRYMCDQAALMYLGKIIEWGTVDQVFKSPQHPYTQALLADIPSTDPDQRMLERVSLESDIFSTRWNGRGCRFPRVALPHKLTTVRRKIPH